MATSAKRARSAPVPRATADERAKQFQEDMYADGSVLFCKFWMPVASVDVAFSCVKGLASETSCFSQHKHLFNDGRESLTEENTQRLAMLYHNGDIRRTL